LIEDTGSTIDLAARGWRLHNHPERLAFSATPSDFGALAIQRRRWANGGLIIFPSLLDLWSRGQSPRVGSLETLIRSHYLLSPALANIGLLLLLIIPFSSEFSNVWFPTAAAPYYLLYGRDLKWCGYQWRDLLRVYALTLMLIPVNLAGVYRSVAQMVTGRKSPFARTPKIEGRTAAPASHSLHSVRSRQRLSFRPAPICGSATSSSFCFRPSMRASSFMASSA
jgi:cellulose synthase (UDP-forming)